MDELTATVATALLGAMTTEAWGEARAAVTGLWQRFRPDQAASIEAELTHDRAQVLVARAQHDASTEKYVRTDWEARLRTISAGNAAAERMLEEIAGSPWVNDLQERRRVTQNAQAFDSGRVYMPARDMTINER